MLYLAWTNIIPIDYIKNTDWYSHKIFDILQPVTESVLLIHILVKKKKLLATLGVIYKACLFHIIHNIQMPFS